jgi:hypothetical protein
VIDQNAANVMNADLTLLSRSLVRWMDTYRSVLPRLYHRSAADVVVVAAAVAARIQEGFVPWWQLTFANASKEKEEERGEQSKCN